VEFGLLTPTAEVEVPTDLVRRLLAGQHLPHEELTEGDGAFPPASRPGLDMNSCAVDGLVVATRVPRYQ
jgi:hypothetical protein